jgi:tripartite-type tricarboxylate transporter receptor subunit TctC
VARSAPDGYTMLITVADALLSASVIMKLPYDPTKDFRPVSKIAAASAVLIASRDTKPNTVAELVAEAKASPAPILYGSQGPGSFPQQVMESLAHQAGVAFTVIHYKGSAYVVNDVVAGHLPYGFTSPNVAAPFLAQGKVKVIATVGDKRSPILPHVPTFAESGYKDFIFRNRVWVGLLAPAGVPEPIIDKIAAGIQQVLGDASFQKFLSDMGFELMATSPAVFQNELREEASVILPLIRKLGVTAQ